jgi:hypothetical protein
MFLKVEAASKNDGLVGPDVFGVLVPAAGRASPAGRLARPAVWISILLDEVFSAFQPFSIFTIIFFGFYRP